MPPPTWVTNGLLAYYPLNGDAKDHSGHGFDGFPSGIDLTAPGRPGGASNSAGFCCLGTQNINLGGNGGGFVGALQGLQQGSITFWYLGSPNPTTYNYKDLLLYSGRPSGNPLIIAANAADSLTFGVEGAVNGTFYGGNLSTLVPSNSWNSVAFVYDDANSTVKYYVNGLPVGQQPIQFGWGNTSDLSLSLGHGFTGEMADVRFYNRALNDQEIALLHTYELNLYNMGPRVATVVPQIVNGFVVGAEITDGGAGYTNSPNVTIIDSTGSGATASASISDGVVTGITILTTGSFYDSSTMIVIDPPPFPPSQAKAIAVLTNGFVIGVTITDGGHDYGSVPPPVHFLGGGGFGATGVASVSNGIVTGIMITSLGSGYTNAPNVLIAVPPGFPSLSLAVSQVKVTMKLPVGYNYQVQTTTDLGGSWSNVGSSFLATESPVIQTLDVTSVSQHFRVVEVP